MAEKDQAEDARPATVPATVMGLPARAARFIALAVGGAAAVAVLVFGSGAPWWMAPFVFLVAGVVMLRLLRPSPRIASWADEA